MIISRCHQTSVHVYCGAEGTAFYICDQCGRACDTLSSNPRMETVNDDTGNVCEVKEIPHSA